MLSDDALFWPMVAHAALVFILYILLSVRRQAAVKAGRATVSQFRENRNEPEDSIFVHNNLKNQFELPVLFYVVSFALYLNKGDNLGMAVLAWIFVASRYVHSYVHVTSNRIRYRRPAFIVGLFSLMAMWAWLAIWLALT